MPINNTADRHTLIPYRTADVRDLLLEQSAPVMESTLLSRLSKRFSYPLLRRELLFEFHFSLFHALYRLKIGIGTHYLHMDPMRLRLVALPAAGQCGRYDPETGTFCREERSSAACRLPGRIPDLSFPVTDYVKRFYLDARNIAFGKTYDLERNMNRILYYGINKDAVDRALAFFGLSYPDRTRLVMRYRQFAMKHHPDRTGDQEKMKEINRHFGVLKTLL